MKQRQLQEYSTDSFVHLDRSIITDGSVSSYSHDALSASVEKITEP